jgi:dehydrogenase/reductase SDR family member 7B
LKEKVVIITGASSGIGLACAKIFSARKYNVTITGRDESKLREAENTVRKEGGEVLAVISDVSVEADCKKIIDETISRFGRIDVLINNAGMSMRGLFENTNLDVLRKVVDTNFWGTVYCTKFALPHLLVSKGSVVGVSSIAGKKGLPGRTGYSASKYAMEGFLESLRTENLNNGLHVLVACPGFTATNIRNTALGPVGMPQKESPRDETSMMSADRVAELIYKAVVRRKRDLVLTLNGKITLLLDKFIPGFMDKMVYRHLAKEKDSPFH